MGESLVDAVIDRIQNHEELAIRQEDIKKVVQATRDELNLPYGTPLLRIGAERTEDWAVKGDKVRITVEADRNDANLLALSHMSGGIVIFGVNENLQPTEIERVADENAEGDGDGEQGELPDASESTDADEPVRPERKKRGRGRSRN